MIKIDNYTIETYGWETAVRGMRNPMNSWEKSDTTGPIIGENDMKLMKSLIKSGPDHAKFLRMIGISMDICAPLYWWKEFDTYKVGTVANSCSTMHKIAAKKFTMDDFSHEHLIDDVQLLSDVVPKTQWADGNRYFTAPTEILANTIETLNFYRERYLNANKVIMKDDRIALSQSKEAKKYWWQMIQLLPSSYNQKRTVTLNYAVALNQYHARKNHKLDEWREYCDTLNTLPYFTEFASC